MPTCPAIPRILTLLLLMLSGAIHAQDADADEKAAMAAALAAERPIDAVASAWLEKLTWMEVRDAIASGTTTVIIPTGGIEANGPYLSTGKHNAILEATCPVIARKLGNALCAPVVAFVPEGDIEPPSGAMLFPGSISLRQATFEALLTDIASSLRVHGFTDIVLIGDSGGNQAGMSKVAARLNAEWPVASRAHFVIDFYDPGWEATEDFTEQELGIRETRHDGYHDDIWVTAMMAVTDPEQIRYRQRMEADLAAINGVDIRDLDATIALGEAMIEFRAGLTARAIRAAIVSSRERP